MTKETGAPASKEEPRIRVAAILQEQYKLLLVCHEKAGQRYWMLPGGGVDRGETLSGALCRELWEECGLRIVPKKLVLVSDAIAPDRSRHIVNICFTAELQSGRPVLGEDPRIVDVDFVSWKDLEQLPFYPDFKSELLQLARHDFVSAAPYLGNIWV